MPRYIDADKLIEEMKKENALVEYDEIEEYAEENTEDVAPVIHSNWIIHKGFMYHYGECSNCHNRLEFSRLNGGRGDANYCPNCGAKMRIKNFDNDECYIDELGGHHDCGVGWNPNGYWCGECPKLSCEDCVNIDKK